MRRKDREMPPEFALTVADKCEYAVISMTDISGEPYCVPVTIARDGNAVYFHSAKAGHKIDAIQRQPKASFCIIDQDQIVPDEYTTYYRSVIAFGQIRLLQTEEEKRHAITLLAKKYFPNDTVSHREESINHSYAPVLMLEMAIEHVTGKEAIELVRGQNA